MNTKSRDTLCIIITYFLALLPFVWFGKEMAEVEKICMPDVPDYKSFLFLVFSLVVLYIWFFVHVVIHEAGHMIAGLLTNYRYVSFRVGSFTIVKIAGKLAVKKTKVSGTAGQCLMCPPDGEPEEIEDTWYQLGGVIANLFVCSVFMYMYRAIPLTLTSYYILFLGGLVGLEDFILNLCPMKMGGIGNDGYNIFFTRKDKNGRAALYYVLSVNAHMTECDSVDELPKELLERVYNFDYTDLTNAFVANLYSYLSIIYLGNGEYDLARGCSERLYRTEGVLPIFKNESQCDLLYHEIMNECREEEILKLYDDKLKKYIKQTDCYPSRKMLMYAYYMIYKNDEAQAMRILCELRALKEVCAVKLEGIIAEHEVDRIKAKAVKEVDIDFPLVYNATNGDDEEK